MKIRFRAVAPSVLSLLLFSAGASSLTTERFAAICDSVEGECSDSPVVQAYVGGALDAIAVLNEETEYLGELYCKQPAELFKVSDIVHFILEHRQEYGGRNAMLPVVRYLEERGGC